MQVIAGREKEIAARLKEKGIHVAVPEREITIRRKGKWQTETELFFPGYVFTHCHYGVELYHRIKSVSGIISILPDAIHPVPLHPHEGDFIKICSRGVIGLLDVVKDGKQVTIADGELAGFCGQIVMLRPRQHRAVIKLTLQGKVRLVSVGVKHIITKSEGTAG